MTPFRATASDPTDWLIERPFAQRGWHDIGQHIPENSLKAFEAAIAGGFGIELDVRQTYDHNAIVFHDETLERLTDEDGHVADMDSTSLTRIKLRDGDATLVTLENALMHIRGRAPVLIEAKAGGDDPTALCLPIRRALEGYRGPVGVMSDDPRILAWFCEHAPRVIRGLVWPGRARPDRRLLDRLGLSRRLAIWKGQPDFIACSIEELALMQALRRRGLPVIAWTVRNEQDQAAAADQADNFLFEGERTLVPFHAVESE